MLHAHPALRRALTTLAWAASALPLSLAAPAQAQTYSVAELDRYAPAISDPSHGEGTPIHGDPQWIRSTGESMGLATVRSGTVFDARKFWFVPAYKRVVVKWSSATGKLQPTPVSTSVLPVALNDLGNWAGYIPAKSLVPRNEIAYGYTGASGPDKPAVQIGTKVTQISYGISGRNFEVLGINNRNWVLGSTLVESSTSKVISKGLIWKNGVITELATGGAEYTYPKEMNDNGDVVGRIQTHVNFDSGPYAGTLKEIRQQAALWVNGQLAWTGPLGSEGLAINNAGDILWTDRETAQVYLRSHGSDLPVPFRGRLTSGGSIIGCAPGDNFQTDLAVWKSGHVTVLKTDMASQGTEFPPGSNSCGEATVSTESTGRHLLVANRTLPGSGRPSGLSHFRISGLP